MLSDEMIARHAVDLRVNIMLTCHMTRPWLIC